MLLNTVSFFFFFFEKKTTFCHCVTDVSAAYVLSLNGSRRQKVKCVFKGCHGVAI